MELIPLVLLSIRPTPKNNLLPRKFIALNSVKYGPRVVKTGTLQYRVLCKKNDKNIFLLRYSIFFIFKTIFLCTNIVYKHKSRCLRPFSSLKLTILLIFLKILFVEGLRAKFTKTGPNFRNFSKIAPETFKNRQNLNKFIKIRI